MRLISNFKNICKCCILALVMLFISVPLSVWAQPATIPYHKEPYRMASGILESTEAETVSKFRETVRAPEAAWMRLHFSDYNLGKQSYITITSHKDGGKQRLDANSLQQWRNSTGAFNGDAVDIELYIAPEEKGIFINIGEITVGEHVTGPTEEESRAVAESLCEDDDRVSLNDAAIGRIMPVGCTGWIISNGALLTAGHCTGANMQYIEFNVLPSQSNGTTVMSLPQDQYPIDPASIVFFNDGGGAIGNDWAVFDCFANTTTSLLPEHAQGAFYRMSRDDAPANIRITGYGTDSSPPGSTGNRNDDSQTEQTDTGGFVGEDVQASNDVVIEYTVDTTGGNSGSPVINTTNALTIGIHTNAGCDPPSGDGNNGTGFENDDLENAIQTFPGPNVVYADKDHPVALEDGGVFRPFDTIGEAVTAVPAGGIVSIVTGSYDETLTINKAMTLTAPVGMVNIGTLP